MERILFSCKGIDKKNNIYKHPHYGNTIIAFQLSELDTLDCLRKQPCLALLTLAASLLGTTMKLRVASCNLTHWCRTVERKWNSKGNRIHPFNSSCWIHTEPAPFAFLNALRHSSSLHSHTLPLLSSLCFHFLIHGGCTPDSFIPYTCKRLVMQSMHIHTLGTQMQITLTCTHHVLLHKNIYPSNPSLKSQPVKNGGSSATAFSAQRK